MTTTDLDNMIATDDQDDDGLDDDELLPVSVQALHRRRGRRVPRRVNPRGKPQPPAPPANRYPHVYAWVTDWLAHVYAHEIDGNIRSYRWCPEWWRHPSALTRLEAAWKAWEQLRNDPGTGASIWFRDHGDMCMAALTNPDTGAFVRCSSSVGHRPTSPLPTAEPPAWLFEDLSDPAATMPV